MNILSGFSSALSGIHNGFESLQKNACQMADATGGDAVSDSSLVDALVGLKVSEIQISASMQTVKAQYDVLGTLLDTKA